MDLIAADLDALNEINKPRLLNGGEISDFSGNQMSLPNRFTSKYGLKEGDTVTLLGSIVPILKSRRMKLVKEVKFE